MPLMCIRVQPWGNQQIILNHAEYNSDFCDIHISMFLFSSSFLPVKVQKCQNQENWFENN